MGRKWAVVAACLYFVASVAVAQEAARTRTFNDIKCKLTLPVGGQWLDQSQMPGEVKAFFEVPSGLRALLLAKKFPGIQLNEDVIRGLEDGITGDGQAELTQTKNVTFCSVPARQIRGRLTSNDVVFVTRAFCANDCLYQFQVLGPPELFEDENSLESVFAAFEFAGEPKLRSDAPAGSTVTPPPGRRGTHTTYEKALSFSAWMGRLVGIILIAIVVILVVRLVLYLIRRKNKGPGAKQAE